MLLEIILAEVEPVYLATAKTVYGEEGSKLSAAWFPSVRN
jgi:hypothetical protein